MVTKLVLTDLAETGTIVGRLSGLGTAGAIAGTVLTGFVLITRVPVSQILIGLGIVCVVSAVAVAVWLRRRPPVLLLALLAGAVVPVAFGPQSCSRETTYHCAEVATDADRPTGRLLRLDGMEHSYVDLADPRYLGFDYVRALGGIADTAFSTGQPLDALHIGGGGMTFPRYLQDARPGTNNVVSEIDPGIVRLDTDELGAQIGPQLEVRVEDSRTGVAQDPTDSYDLVVGDAFGGVSVPWHLATREATEEVRRVLRPGGLYTLNLIDHGDLAFARAEVATIADTFTHVAAFTAPATAEGDDGGNVVVVASDEPIDVDEIEGGITAQGLDWVALHGEELDTWTNDAAVLTDDYAPVDQLLTPYPTS